MELRRAFENSQLEVYYQPKYETRSLQAAGGGEALLRWFHPQRGQISTADFIAVAEEIGLIGDISRWVLAAGLSRFMPVAQRGPVAAYRSP